jgi:hypothetical protein
MMLRLPVLTALCIGLALPALAAQVPSATGAAATATPDVDVAKLPINLARIGRQLRQSQEREERNGLKLHYLINVYGAAPPIKLVTPLDNLLTVDVPHSAPTHTDMLRMMTPREFSAGVTLLTIPRRK